MYSRICPELVLALLLWLPYISALSLPFFFGLSSELRSLTSALDKDSTNQLLYLLRHHDLQQICHHNQHPAPNSTSVAIGSPFNGLGFDNGDLLALSLPSIFRNIIINGNWNDAEKRTHALGNCPAVGLYARNLKVDIFVWDKFQRPPKYLAPRLAGLLSTMQEPGKLALVNPEYHTGKFEPEFTNLSFPHVKTLVVGPCCDFAVTLCPNVQTLSSNGWPFNKSHMQGDIDRNHTINLVQAAGSVRNLTRLELDEHWDAERLNDILQAVPNIPSLALNIAVASHWRDDGLSSPRQKLLPVLSRFTNLQYLALPDISSLGVGFNPPGCGNAYMGPDGEVFRQEIEEEGFRYTIEAVDMVFLACSKLRDLWIGDQRHIEAQRTENGSIADLLWQTCFRRDIVFDLWAQS